MRVVAGTARRRRLVAPPGDATRPTSDRVREATFNSLGSLGAVEGARVLDLFAGSGAMGIEALSRGAAHATFVDDDRRAIDAIRANLATTGFEAAATVVRGDALRYVADHPGAFDLVVADPPYAFDRWPELFAVLDAPVVVAESDRALDPGAQWVVVRSRRSGSTVVTIARRADHRSHPEETAP